MKTLRKKECDEKSTELNKRAEVELPHEEEYMDREAAP